MTATVIDRGAFTAIALTRLQTVTSAKVYLGEPTGPVPISNVDGRILPYAILWPGGGTPSPEQNMADTSVDLDWSIQITCAAGNESDVMDLVTAVDTAFYRWTPVVAGFVCGPLKPPNGYDPGPVRYDRNVHPSRPYLPLQYAARITAT